MQGDMIYAVAWKIYFEEWKYYWKKLTQYYLLTAAMWKKEWKVSTFSGNKSPQLPPALTYKCLLVWVQSMWSFHLPLPQHLHCPLMGIRCHKRIVWHVYRHRITKVKAPGNDGLFATVACTGRHGHLLVSAHCTDNGKPRGKPGLTAPSIYLSCWSFILSFFHLCVLSVMMREHTLFTRLNVSLTANIGWDFFCMLLLYKRLTECLYLHIWKVNLRQEETPRVQKRHLT